MVIRSTWCYGDFHPQTGHLYSQRGKHTGPAGTHTVALHHFIVWLIASACYLLYFNFFLFVINFCLDAENAGLPEGKKRCWLFQKFIWTDDVLQVMKPNVIFIAQLQHNAEILNRKMQVNIVNFCLFIIVSVLDLNAFERQNKAEGLGMVTEEGSSKWGEKTRKTVHLRQL